MKSSSLLLSIFLLFLTNTSCKKSCEIKNMGLVGKWKLVEVFDGYANGGSFTWNKISDQDSHILTFAENGKYNRKDIGSSSPQECIGTYQLLDRSIEINSNCNTVIEKLSITQLTATTLYVEHSVREGKIKYKYSATK